MSIKAKLSVMGVIFTGLMISGCTTIGVGGSQTQETVKTSKPVTVSPDTHTHPANKCTNSISHTHASGAKTHKHRYSCQSNVKKDANNHAHPANKYTRSMRHTHPSGAGKHTHKYTNHR